MTPGACREPLVTFLSMWCSWAVLVAGQHTLQRHSSGRKGLFKCLVLTLTLLCPQAAELVSENCEAYEAHMRDIRDYLEERLEVRGTCPHGRVQWQSWDQTLSPCEGNSVWGPGEYSGSWGKGAEQGTGS